MASESEATSEDQVKCILHVGKSFKAKTILFTAETLSKCRNILHARQLNNLRSKYANIVLPNDVDKCCGYHRDCYKRFTALSINRLNEKSNNLPPNNDSQETSSAITLDRKLTRSTGAITKSTSRTGVLEARCLFCDQKTKKSNGKKEQMYKCLTKEIEMGIRKDIADLQDMAMMAKTTDLDFVAKEVQYHRICRLRYGNQVLKSKKSKESKPIKTDRDAHKYAFSKLLLSIEFNILKKEEVHSLKELFNQYMSILVEFSGRSNTGDGFQISHLEEKIRKHFGERLVIAKRSKKRKGKIVYNAQMDSKTAIQLYYENSMDTVIQIRQVASVLRNEIRNAKKIELPSELSVDNIVRGEVEIPELLKEFLRHLIHGPDSTSNPTANKQVRIESISNDIVYATSNGRKVPGKQMHLGLVMKSITGSRKVVEILNRFGHSVSYSAVESLETELAFSVADSSQATPSGLRLSPYLRTGLAFDNFDCFVETINGKDTLHDTVGIAYQEEAATDILDSNVIESASQDETAVMITDVAQTRNQLRSAGRNFDFTEQSSANSTDVQKKKPNRRRRAFEAIGTEIEPYRKQPRMASSLRIVPLDDQRRHSIPSNLSTAKMSDTLWIMSLTLDKKETPMWVGYNAKRIKDPLPIQKIAYMTQIDQSPTSLSVVAETLRICQKVARECKQSVISVTYDLAIAKMAYTIQATEAPTYDNVFIQLGSFHIELSFFKALGKYIAESGGPYVLSETGVLAAGSMKGFITGTHYNRCKRLHQLLAAAFEMLHFDSFLQTIEELTEDTVQDILTTSGDLSSVRPSVRKVLDEYEKYCDDTKKGEHGKTAEYWFTYVQYMHLYKEFSRAIRTGDLDLYLHSLPQLGSIFFAFNHPNYARWLIQYHSKLLTVDETHPTFRTDLENGAFSIRRTPKSFSRTPIDLTLEQTQNADAANSLTGITCFTNSISARQRWSRTHSSRTELISRLYENLNMKKKDDVTRDLRNHNIAKDRQQLNAVVNFVRNCLNPFTSEASDLPLVNISTGRAASNLTSDFLLNVISIGDRARDKFIDECVEDPYRFEKPITRGRINTFANDGAKYKKSRADGKVVELKMERDLMGRLLCIALENKVDMAEILSYPLTPVPLCLSHLDGSMNKTNKAVLFNELEKKIEHSPPSRVDCTIIDGMFFFHLLGDVPLNFGKISAHILKKICNTNSKRIDVVFDRTESPSIKDFERDQRASNQDRSMAISITGPNQQRQPDFLKSLRNDQFKESLVSFLVASWDDDSLSSIIGNKLLYVTSKEKCYLFQQKDNKIIKSEVKDMCCYHEEADSRMVFHLSTLPSRTNVVIRSADTDVMAILLGNIYKLKQNVNIWMEVGVQSKNTLRYIDVSSLAKKLGESLCRSLPGFHSFTGCDFSPAFSRKGKKQPFAQLEKNLKSQVAFATLGSSKEVPPDVIQELESFACSIYGRKALKTINEARLDLFLKTYKPKKKNPLVTVRGIDGSSLPPCRNVLMQHISRSNYICGTWNYATQVTPNILHPELHGWELSNGKYSVRWFTGDMVPSKIRDIIIEENEEDADEERDSENDDALIEATDESESEESDEE